MKRFGNKGSRALDGYAKESLNILLDSEEVEKEDTELTESEKELLNLIISQIIKQILPCLP